MPYKKTGFRQGEAHPNVRLTVQQVVAIYLSLDKVDYLAAVYRVSPTAIYNIRKGKTWKHLTSRLQRPIKTGKMNKTK